MDDDNDTEGTEDRVAHEVVWLSRAQRHLTEIVVYIAEDNPTAAISVKERIEQAATHLSANPRWGAKGASTGRVNWSFPDFPMLSPIAYVLAASRSWM